MMAKFIPPVCGWTYEDKTRLVEHFLKECDGRRMTEDEMLDFFEEEAGASPDLFGFEVAENVQDVIHTNTLNGDVVQIDEVTWRILKGK